ETLEGLLFVPISRRARFAFPARPMPTNQLKTLPMLGLLLLATAPEQASASSQAIPLWFKLLYSAYVAILIPAYWRYYGLGNFLWFSDLALFITLAAVWLESPLLASMQAVSVG